MDFDLRRVARQLDQRSPFGMFEYVDVVFNATANNDTMIRHALAPSDPEGVDWQVVRIELPSAPGTVPVVYRDGSASRRPWGDGYIVLRSTVASLKATLLLTTRQRSSQ